MKIYFYCHPQGDNRYPAFQHQLINLAFGLKELGIEYYSNKTYWKIGEDEFLFNKSDIKVDDCDVLVSSHGEFEYNWKLPAEFFTEKRKYLTVYIDTADGLFTRSYSKEFENIDLILKQKTKGMWYPKNCKYSWAFGLSPYMKLEQDKMYDFQEREKDILANYRHVHTFRKQGEKIIASLNKLQINKKSEPLDYTEKRNEIQNESDFYKLGHLQSGGRFHPDYLQRLRQSYSCSCFGGNLLPSSFFVQNQKIFKIGNYFYDNTNQGRIVNLFRKLNLQIKHRYGVFQWDSWRLWETFSAKTVVINVDFNKYGIELPVMPENFKHYIGIDLLNPKESIIKINSLSYQELEQIANEGAKWADENYSPKAVALRFIEILKLEI
jgi:hypothetical protein